MEIKDLVPVLPVHPTKKPKVRKLSTIKKIVVHTTDWNIEPLELAKYDIGPNHIDSTGCPTATYHYYISKTGEVSRLVPEEFITWHAAMHNGNSLAICLAYKTDPAFESGKTKIASLDKLPTAEMLSSLSRLLVHLCKEFKISPKEIWGHRELLGTGFIISKGHKQLRKTCPGMSIDLDLLRKDTILVIQSEMASLGLYSGNIDGLWGPKSEASFQELLNYKG
jgi:N-acetyl-anhydromuramyl-L-alanine amidase AmpD